MSCDVNIIHEHGRFTTSVYRKPTFSGIYTHFDSFLPSTYKIGVIYIHCYLDVSGFAQIGLTFYLELFKLMDVFKINDYPENFIDSYFKTFLDNENSIQETVITVLKKP